MNLPSALYLDENSPPKTDSWGETHKMRTGWYFWDDEGDLVGPYPDKQMAEEAIQYFFGRG
jgi:hypothetical protein